MLLQVGEILLALPWNSDIKTTRENGRKRRGTRRVVRSGEGMEGRSPLAVRLLLKLLNVALFNAAHHFLAAEKIVVEFRIRWIQEDGGGTDLFERSAAI